MVYLNGNVLLGYNVYFGLRKIDTEDTFALYQFENDSFSAIQDKESWEFLHNDQFLETTKIFFHSIKKPKADSVSSSFFKFLAIFQTGSTHRDTKVFRWLSDGKRRPDLQR